VSESEGARTKKEVEKRIGKITTVRRGRIGEE